MILRPPQPTQPQPEQGQAQCASSSSGAKGDGHDGAAGRKTLQARNKKKTSVTPCISDFIVEIASVLSPRGHKSSYIFRPILELSGQFATGATSERRMRAKMFRAQVGNDFRPQWLCWRKKWFWGSLHKHGFRQEFCFLSNMSRTWDRMGRCPGAELRQRGYRQSAGMHMPYTVSQPISSTTQRIGGAKFQI